MTNPSGTLILISILHVYCMPKIEPDVTNLPFGANLDNDVVDHISNIVYDAIHYTAKK